MTKHRRTEDLILELASTPAPAPFNPAAFLGAMALLLAAMLGLFFAGFGLRADLASAWPLLPVQAKTILPVLLSVAAVWLALRSSSPGQSLRLWPLAVPVVLALAMFAYRLSGVESALLEELVGKTALACLASIMLLSLIPLAAGVMLFRRTATTQPVLTGALLGLATGAGVAAGYALHCTEDSPLFFVTWYGLGILLMGGVGAALGHRVLRW